MKNRIYPCLWFDGQAKVAAEFYCSIFKNSKILSGNPMVVNFELNGFKFMGLMVDQLINFLLPILM
jgi:predicted 3-demethylubiquinone-9 3-methyltransferase (glyoxalase superfamily)